MTNAHAQAPPRQSMVLYAVYLQSADPLPFELQYDAMALAPGLYLVRSPLAQSRLYHAIKRLVAPEALFVGALEHEPKFKGLAKGSLKWLRS